jgi:hypothetical protein
VMGQPIVLMLLGAEPSRVLFLPPYQACLRVSADDAYQRGAMGLRMMSAVSSLVGTTGFTTGGLSGGSQRQGQASAHPWWDPRSDVASMCAHVSLLTSADVPTVAEHGQQFLRSHSQCTATDPSEPQDARSDSGSLESLIWGLAPLGKQPGGALADHWGAPLTASLLALISLTMLGGLLLWVPRLRRLE